MRKGQGRDQVCPKKSLIFLHHPVMLMKEKKKVRFARVECLLGMYMMVCLPSAPVLRRGTHKKGNSGI